MTHLMRHHRLLLADADDRSALPQGCWYVQGCWRWPWANVALPDLANQLTSGQGLEIASAPCMRVGPQSRGVHLGDPLDLRQLALGVLTGSLFAQVVLRLPCDRISCVSAKPRTRLWSLLGT